MQRQGTITYLEPGKNPIKEMLLACVIKYVLAIALPSLRISPLLRIALTFVLIYTAALSFSVVYIQSIGSGMVIFSELFNNFLSVQYCAAEEIFSLLLLSSLLPVILF